MVSPPIKDADSASSCAPPRIEGGATELSAPVLSRRIYLLCGFFFKVRGLLAVLLLFAMFLTRRGEGGSAVLNWAVGLTLFGAAFILRIRSQQYLRYRLRDDAGLATTGPYAYVRNPVYIGNITALAGLCILCRLWWMAPLAAGWAFLVYHGSVLFEEMRLTLRFGAPYRQYCERVPRWIPRRPPEGWVQGNHAGFWRALSVEWQDVLLLLVPLGKEWILQPHGGTIRAVLVRAVDLVRANAGLCAVALAVGLIVLAAWNLMRLRRHNRSKRRRGLPAAART